jgi:RNA polymerase sigma-70 factor (ECF subfamily)
MDAVPGDNLPHEEDLPRLLASDLYRYFPSLDKMYRRRLCAFSQKLVGNPDDAEDIVQETFASAFDALACRSAEQIEAMHLWSWLRQIAYHRFINMLRKGKVVLESYDTPEGKLYIETWVDTLFEQPETSLEDGEFRQKVYALLMNLPLKYRTAIVLRHVMEFRYREIAHALGVSVVTARGYVAFGLKKLRKAASDQGYQDSGCFR